MKNPKVCWCCASYTGTRVYWIQFDYSGPTWLARTENMHPIRPLCGKCKRETARGYYVARVERVR